MELLFEGLSYLVLGVGTVFVFLVLLIISMSILAFVVKRFFPPDEEGDSAPAGPRDADIAVAIVAAKSFSRK